MGLRIFIEFYKSHSLVFFFFSSSVLLTVKFFHKAVSQSCIFARLRKSESTDLFVYLNASLAFSQSLSFTILHP